MPKIGRTKKTQTFSFDKDTLNRLTEMKKVDETKPVSVFVNGRIQKYFTVASGAECIWIQKLMDIMEGSKEESVHTDAVQEITQMKERRKKTKAISIDEKMLKKIRDLKKQGAIKSQSCLVNTVVRIPFTEIGNKDYDRILRYMKIIETVKAP